MKSGAYPKAQSGGPVRYQRLALSAVATLAAIKSICETGPDMRPQRTGETGRRRCGLVFNAVFPPALQVKAPGFALFKQGIFNLMV